MRHTRKNGKVRIVFPQSRLTLRALVRRLRDDEPRRTLQLVGDLMRDDSPSSSDVGCLFGKYAEGSDEFREGVNQALVWACGYTLPSLLAMVLSSDREKYEALLARWYGKEGFQHE